MRKFILASALYLSAAVSPENDDSECTLPTDNTKMWILLSLFSLAILSCAGCCAVRWEERQQDDVQNERKCCRTSTLLGLTALGVFATDILLLANMIEEPNQPTCGK